MTSSKITPEQQRAIQVLLLNLPHWKEYYQPEVGSEFAQIPMFASNFMAFSTEPFRKLPHDDTWIWNQSNAKVTTELDQYHECTLQKMNTRKRKNCPKAPSYKIWLYALNKKNQPSHLYFLWCEKGVSQKQMTPLISQNDLQCLDNYNAYSQTQYPEFTKSSYDYYAPQENFDITLDDLSFLRPPKHLPTKSGCTH